MQCVWIQAKTIGAQCHTHAALLGFSVIPTPAGMFGVGIPSHGEHFPVWTIPCLSDASTALPCPKSRVDVPAHNRMMAFHGESDKSVVQVKRAV